MTRTEIKELAKMLVKANEDCYYCGADECIVHRKKVCDDFCTVKDWEKYLFRRFNGTRRKVLPHSRNLR